MSNQRGDGQTYQNKKNEKNYYKNQGKYNNNNFSTFDQQQKTVESGSQQNSQSQNQMINNQQIQQNKSQNSQSQNEYPKNIQQNSYYQFSNNQNSGKQSPATKYQPKESQINSQGSGNNNSGVKYMQKQKNLHGQEKNYNDIKQAKNDQNNGNHQDLENLQKSNAKLENSFNDNLIHDSKLSDKNIENSGQRIVEEQLNILNSGNVKYNQQPANNTSNKLNNASIKDFEEIEKAAKNGNDEELQNLFEKLNKQSKQLNKRQLIQALHATVEGCKSTKNVENHIACFNYLLSFSSDQEQLINGEKNNKLIVMIAAQKGFIELVNEIISKGAWINHVDSNSQNSLYYAIDNQQENLDVVELLIQHKANINKMTTSEGYTPLMLAVKRGHQNIVKTLMIQGAEIAIADFQNNNTALHIACEQGQKEIVEILANEETYDKIYNHANKNDMKAKDIVEQKICNLQSQSVKDQKNLNNFYEILEYLDGLKQKVDEKIDKNGNKLMHEEEKIQEDKQKKLLKKQLEKTEKQQIDIQKETENIAVKDEKSEENINQINNKKQKQKKQQANKNQQKQDQDQELKNQKTQKLDQKDINGEKIVKIESQENEKKISKPEIQKPKNEEKQHEQKGTQNNSRGNQKQKIEKEQNLNEKKDQTQNIDEPKNKESISLEDFQQMFNNQNSEQKIPLEQAQPIIETPQIYPSIVDQKSKQSEIDQNQIRDSQSIPNNTFPQQQQQVFPQKNVFQYQNQGKAEILQPQPIHHVQNEIVQQPGQVQINNLHTQHQNQALNLNKQQSNVNKNKSKVQPNVQNQNMYNQQQIQSPQFQNYNFGQGSLNNIQNSQQNIQNTNLQPDNLNQHFNNQQHQNQLGVITQNVNIASNLQQQFDQSQIHAIQQLSLFGLMQNGIGGVNLNNLNLGLNQVQQQSQNADHSQQNLVPQQIPGGQIPVKGLQYGAYNQILNGQSANIDQNLLQNQLQFGQQRSNNTPVNQIPGQNIINQQNINTQHSINLNEINNIQLQNGQQSFGQFQNQFNQPNQLIYTGIQNNQQQINQNMLLGQLGIANGNPSQIQNTQQQKPNMFNQQQLLNIPNHLNNGQNQNPMILPNLQDIPQNLTNTQNQNLLPGSGLTNNHIIIGNQAPLLQIQKQQKLPIKVDLDLSDEKSLNLFIYKQKYNMKKNDYFNLEKRKIELEKEISSKDNEILRLKELNRKYQLYNSLKDQGLDDSINLQKLIFHHNKQVHLITHFKEKYEKSQQFCIDLLNKSNEAIKLIKQMQSSQKEKDHKIEDDQRPAVSNREVIDVGKNPIKKASERHLENSSEKPSEEQINEIIESIQTFDELMEKTLEAKDSEEIIEKLNLNEVSLKIFNYDLVKNIIQKEHQTSNILLMEKRYEIPLMKPQIPDIKKLLSAHAYALLLTQYPNFEEIHTRHNIQQIHNILHNEILLFKQDANAIMKEMAEVKQILILKVENIIKSCNQDYTIDVYGSHRTGLCMYWSDIDIVVNPPNMVYPIEALSYINDRLEREKSSLNQWITNVNYKRKATVPVVTITCSLAAIMKQENLVYPKNPCYESIYEKTISVDITCNNYYIDMHLGHRHLGIECVELVQQYIKDCWLIEPLLLVLKQLLKVNGLNEPFKGGMSSYGLLLMIVGFLQFRHYDIPCEPKLQNLGEILLDFLQYFSNFDFKNKQINCKRPDEYSQYNYNREVIQQKSLIDQIPFPYANESPTILDPLKNDSNVTKSTYQFREIQEIFKVAHQCASVGCYCNSHFSLSGIEAQNKHSQDLQNLEYLILSLVDDPSAQAGAVCQYLQSKQTGTPSLIQYQNVGNEQDNQIHMYVQNGEEKIVPIESLYKPVFVEHSHQCDSILAKIIYSYAQIKTARENSNRITS